MVGDRGLCLGREFDDITWANFQGAILFPILYNISVCPQAQLIQGFELGYVQYANDTQVYLLMDGQTDSTSGILAKALEAVSDWLQQSQLKPNPAKTEVLFKSGG